MINKPSKKHLYAGIGLAVLATMIWSANFIISRGLAYRISPISLSFYRWATASLVLWPLAWKKFGKEKKIIFRHKGYFFFTAITGISIFNTLVYYAGHYSPAINLALIGTTSSPVFSIILAAIFLGERIRPLRIAGLLICFCGIVILICQGNLQLLLAFHFSPGDILMLGAALFFATYNIMVRRKPAGISPFTFLFSVVATGTLILFPFYVWDSFYNTATHFDWTILSIILYLGIGASVLSFLCWNYAIAQLGAARTALFGNLIPVFSSLEAVLILGERITLIHIISGVLVLTGLFLANLKRAV